MREFLCKYSGKHKKMFKISKCGTGGESTVMETLIAGMNVVIKCPNELGEINRA